ncbi:multifunctional oxoglutarate decarboxylase/oxoglutarate dehydrogenase thiamine pyrophosphate-binding subunit/dihydrolipoyllysine-residue succinyltransferase subunit [bacterium]|nr:MAG: multifunctional oxoglutarate decarboxylase/oxoglutarate dehydrogenase thiamine pyrophosphate-binding subunit/dihydrolipoyllysine-residue succinyltransferase subunit [bacterium]
MKSLEEIFGPNTALVEDLYNQYVTNPNSVPTYWRNYFDESLGKEPAPMPVSEPISAPSATTVSAPIKPAETVAKKADTVNINEEKYEYEKIKGVAAKIVTNMEESLEIPTATSLRVIPVKMLIEDRTIINRHLEQRGDPKATFTNFIAWAVIKAIKEYPSLSHSLHYVDGVPTRVKPKQINLGIAIDLPGKNGARNLVVPNIKAVDRMNFNEFLAAYYALIAKARAGKLEVEDFADTTISITNPGTIGTVSSAPRLMKGQGAIIATGAMEYPAEFQAMSQEVLNHLGISKVMTFTSTYDHRIIQGAESGAFLAKIHALLNGEEDFYDSIFGDLDIPYKPIDYGTDNYTGFLDNGSSEVNKKAIGVIQLINMYRTRGHLLADLNPLKHGPGHYPELEFDYYGLTIWDLDREFYCGGLGGFEKAPLRVIVKLLRDTYCGFIGAEFMHILELAERKWLREKMESSANTTKLSVDEKKQILHKLNQAMAFEQFLHKKYVGHKRFSLEGGETMIPMIDYMLEKGGDLGVEEVILGMAHRGRLNVLVNTMGKKYHKVFAEFDGNIDPTTFQGSGDVKYHLGTTGYHKTQSGKEIRLQLLANPSHLEAVNPVVEGTARARQDSRLEDDAATKIIPLLIHGDAAFAGQGVVPETLNMSQLRGYKTGGTIHIIINNQIGFTTLPVDARSTTYASDIAKTIMAPIFHVNGDEPEAAVHAMRMALEYRQEFSKDVVIDLICYRKYGHNEGDEPAFTQPGLYKEINDHLSVRDIYANELMKKKQLTKDEVNEIFEEFNTLLEQAFEDAKQTTTSIDTASFIDRKETKQAERESKTDTSFPLDELKKISQQILTVPKDFDANPKLLRILAKRHEIVENNEKKIEWGFAESLAFGSILVEGRNVRLTGQDVERGTFSHRHSVLHGTESAQKYVPLNNIQENQGRYMVYNSHLSEFAVLGFEFGYSSTDLNQLVLWEAQFGDFSNGAQIIIDQFISSCEAKWGQKTAVTMLLPHGFEGQGPEHSSARLERYLQLCAEDNMRVVNVSTPAQYFHLLRRQVVSDVKKPLVVMSPKSLLRHPSAVSSVEELANGAFHELLDDETPSKSDIKRVILSAGKVYYDLAKYREDHSTTDTALVRLEQFYPFPDADMKAILASYPNAKDVVWCQEEPKNMGAWTFAAPRIMNDLADGQKLRYAGRAASASPATGSAKLHQIEQDNLVSQAFGN